MITIDCLPSPFVFSPIVRLLQKINYQPKTLREFISLGMIDPLNPIYKAYRKKSHLSESLPKEDQIRQFGKTEIDRNLILLARSIAPYLKSEDVKFLVHSQSKNIDSLYDFIRIASQCEGNIHISQSMGELEHHHSTCQESAKIEQLYYSDDEIKKENRSLIVEAAKECISVNDYYSAKNLLKSLEGLRIDDEEKKSRSII